MSARLLWPGLLALAVIGSSIADTHPPIEPERRGDYLVLRADFHVHTRLSDGFLTPFDIPMAARREGLHVVGVTEHNLTFAARWARWMSELVGGPLVVVGSEVTTRRYHVIALGIDDRIDWSLELPDVLDAIHAQGGVAIAAHPAAKWWSRFEPHRDRFDGSEVMHPIAFRGETPSGWRWSDMRDFWLKARAEGFELAAIGSSDFHFFKALGAVHTLVFAHEATQASVLEAIRAARTVVFDLQGNAYGDPEMIALLETEPLRPVLKQRAYASEGGLDLASRTLGWLALVGLIVFRQS